MRKFLFFVLGGMVLIGAVGAAVRYFQVSGLSIFSSANASERDRLIDEIAGGRLIWSRDGKVVFTTLKPWKPTVLTRGENPRWSFDGRYIAYTFDDHLWLMNADASHKRQIIADVVSDYGTGGYWTLDNRGVVAISKVDSRTVLKYDLKSAKVVVVHDESKSPFKGFKLSQCAEFRFDNRYLLTFTTDKNHRAMIIDQKTKRYIANPKMLAGDCEPAWSPDGTFALFTRRSYQRPIYKARFDPHTGVMSPSEYLIGTGRCRRAAVSNDSRYVLYASGGHIYCWKIGWSVPKPRHGVKLTMEGDNSDPNLFIPKSP